MNNASATARVIPDVVGLLCKSLNQYPPKDGLPKAKLKAEVAKLNGVGAGPWTKGLLRHERKEQDEDRNPAADEGEDNVDRTRTIRRIWNLRTGEQLAASLQEHETFYKSEKKEPTFRLDYVKG